MTKSGVYTITNIMNGKVYIGSTVDFDKRWKVHRCYLQQNGHPNIHLQRSWNRHGEKAFKFSVLEYLDNLEELHLAEQFWIDVYREEDRELYNIAIPGRSPMLGREHTEKTKRKISKARKGKPSSRVGYKTSKETKRKLSVINMGKVLSKDHRRNIGIGHAKPYPAFINKGTDEIIPAGFNLSALCRKLGLHKQGLSAVIHGRAYSYYGWILIDND